jgi:DNA-binding NarL/FixJ family response regulator/nitrate/nitrite-specific signal transduction histidine kinase
MMKEATPSKLSQRVKRLRWQAPLLALLLVLAHQLAEHTWLMHLPRWQHFTTQVLFYGLIGPLLAWWALSSLLRSISKTEATQRALGEANQRLEFLIQVNRRLAEAEDEETLIEVILDLPLEVVPTVGCSLIRFDERGQPLPALHRGDLDPATFEAWTAHLATAKVRQACERCVVRQATELTPCSLLESFPVTIAAHRVYCIPLERGGREYGMLNIYLAEADHPTSREQILLMAMADEVSLALESQYLRSRELATLYHLQQARRLSNLEEELEEVLTHTVQALEVDGGALFVADVETAELDLLIEIGHPLNSTLHLVKSLVNGLQQTESTLIIRDLKQGGDAERGENMHSLLLAPLRNEGQLLGSLVLWAARTDAFADRHSRLMTTIAGQIALLIENHRLYLQAEYQAALAERARLAREIHDGLAQTLGYLKLRMAQMATWLQRGEIERVSLTLKEIRSALEEAYVDAREAIDGLRLKPGEGGLTGWLDQIMDDFQNLSHIQLEVVNLPPMALSMEVQAQLLRIVQEALSNIRKHSGASQARLEWQSDTPEGTREHRLLLRITDNGQGFDPMDVPLISQHGLRIMRERLNCWTLTSKLSVGPVRVLRWCSVCRLSEMPSRRCPPGYGVKGSIRGHKVTEPIKVLVVDDHTLFRRGIVALLSEEADFKLVGEASSGPESLELSRRYYPDVVLMDIHMPGGSGVEAVRSLKQTAELGVLMLTISENDEDLFDAIEAGADGYLLKNAEPETLCRAIRQVAAGQAVLSPEVIAKVMHVAARSRSRQPQVSLSQREQEVLIELAKGATTAEIAATLIISPNTVKTHIRHILEKLDASNRAEAISRANAMGLLK